MTARRIHLPYRWIATGALTVAALMVAARMSVGMYYDNASSGRLVRAIGKRSEAVDAIFANYGKATVAAGDLPLGVSQCCPPSSIAFIRYSDPAGWGSVVVSFDAAGTAVGGAPEY